MLELTLMKKVIVHAHTKNDSFLQLHFHPRIKQLAVYPLNLCIALEHSQAGEVRKTSYSVSFEPANSVGIEGELQ
jgi:hypothetical protein